VVHQLLLGQLQLRLGRLQQLLGRLQQLLGRLGEDLIFFYSSSFCFLNSFWNGLNDF
jgi:hypothetical protein